MNGWYELNSGTMLNLDKITLVIRDIHGDKYAILDCGDKVEISTQDYHEIYNILFGVEK